MLGFLRFGFMPYDYRPGSRQGGRFAWAHNIKHLFGRMVDVMRMAGMRPLGPEPLPGPVR